MGNTHRSQWGIMESLAPQARICCLDLDTFFVSVERLFRP